MSVVCIGGTKGARGADLVSMLVSSALVPSIVGGDVRISLFRCSKKKFGGEAKAVRVNFPLLVISLFCHFFYAFFVLSIEKILLSFFFFSRSFVREG